MNREILFKGKRVSNSEWVEGYIVKRPTGEWQIERRCDNPPDGDPMWKKVLITYEVKPDTICQYTGLKDKNSKKIWENDIVKDSRGNLYKVFWQENYYQFAFICIKANDALLFGAKWDLWSLAKNKDLELQGSIFDNPEFLEGGEEE